MAGLLPFRSLSVPPRSQKAWFVDQGEDFQQSLASTKGGKAKGGPKNRKTKEEDSRVRRAWLRADADGSGQLDKEEVKAVLLGMELDVDVEQVFHEIDEDGSGTVEYAEFKAWFVLQEAEAQQRVSAKAVKVRSKKLEAKEEDSKMRQAWLGADTDGSGSLDREELRKVLVSMDFPEDQLEEMFDDLFEEIDTDGSGAVEYGEFKAWFVQQEAAAQERWQEQAATSMAEPEDESSGKEEDMVWRAWLKADADGSGQLDKEELKVVLEGACSGPLAVLTSSVARARCS